MQGSGFRVQGSEYRVWVRRQAPGEHLGGGLVDCLGDGLRRVCERLNESVGLSQEGAANCFSGTSLMENTPLLEPYSRPTPRALWWYQGGGRFLMSEVPL